MRNWLYFIESDREYHKLMEFFDGEKDVNGITYLIFNEEVSCSRDKIFRVHNNLLISVNFFTYSIDPKDKMVEFSLGTDSLINYYELTFGSSCPTSQVEMINKMTKRIIFTSDLIKFLEGLHFTFRDGSPLTMPDSMALKEALRLSLLSYD